MLPFWRVGMSELRFDGEFCGDYAGKEWDSMIVDHNAWCDRIEADEVDPTGGCGWDSIEADDVDSEADWNDERQPDEAQEWHDFDPDC